MSRKPKPEETMSEGHSAQNLSINSLASSTLEQASSIAAKAGLDKYAIFDQWRDKAIREGMPSNLDGAFLSYLRAAVSNSEKREPELF